MPQTPPPLSMTGKSVRMGVKPWSTYSPQEVRGVALVELVGSRSAQ